MVTMLSQGAVRTTFSPPIRKLHSSMEVETLQEETDNELIRRRMYLASIYHALPDYGSTAFWRAIEEPDEKAILPLEVLVKCLRLAITYQSMLEKSLQDADWLDLEGYTEVLSHGILRG